MKFKTFLQFITEQEEGVVHGIHYSHQPNLTHLEGGRSGTGIAGREQRRLEHTIDPRIKSRVYFYNHNPSEPNLPRPETGLGVHVYKAKLHNIYNPSTASDEQRAEVTKHKQKYLDQGEDNSNAFESAVLDTKKYQGYTNAGMTVVLGQKHVPVEYHGTRN